MNELNYSEVKTIGEDFSRYLATESLGDNPDKIMFYRDIIRAHLGYPSTIMPSVNPYLEAYVFKPTDKYDYWNITFMANKKLRQIIKRMKYNNTTHRRMLEYDYYSRAQLFTGSPDRDTFMSKVHFMGSPNFLRRGWFNVTPSLPLSQEMVDLFVEGVQRTAQSLTHMWVAEVQHNVEYILQTFDNLEQEIISKRLADESFWNSCFYDPIDVNIHQ
tara:strand:- start:2268 stop:2915 length:648 start_codon:yes stop_codon:yes gene_type:complete